MGLPRAITLVGCLTALTFAPLAVAAGCGHATVTPNDGKVHIVAGFYPFQFVAEQVGGDRVSVTNLARPGAEPHDLELSPRQMASIVDADIVIHLRGFQPAVDQVVQHDARDSSFDVATVVPLRPAPASRHHTPIPDAADPPEALANGLDPHVWLDPVRLATIARSLADRLATVDPEGAADYRARAASLVAELGDLDRDYRAELAHCDRRQIVVSHSAFGYLTDRYGLDQIAIMGLSPDSEPTPARLAEAAAEARRYGATTIFFESLVSPKVAEAVAGETGATTAVLDPIEGLPPGSAESYVTVMRTNLTALTSALGCA
jgi:zinc transport system substrate-binding protein